MLSGAVAKAHGVEGLPQGTITVKPQGVAGQSFGTSLAPGIDLFLEGEGNDYVGKGQAGGRIVIRPPKSASTSGIKTRSSVTPSCTVRPVVRSLSVAAPANVSVFVTPASLPLLKALVITVLNT